jgi:uncharacterized protein
MVYLDWRAPVSLAEIVKKDMVASMKAHDAERTSTLRMMMTALKSKEIEKRGELSEAEELQTLTTMVKQRHESIEAFTKGDRPLLAEKEAAEIVVIEAYMPKVAGEAQIREAVTAVIAELTATGTKPGTRDMGNVMKAVQAKIQSTGLRADGRKVSEIVKVELAS